jgi:hypothetical protein
MDPVTMGAVLLAIVTGVAEDVGSKLWGSITTLVRRPFTHPQGNGTVELVGSGAAELAALERSPHDEQRALALARALLARAGADDAFRQELEAWWAQAESLRTGDGGVTNTISGGTQHGPVFQGRDFTGDITLGSVQ